MGGVVPTGQVVLRGAVDQTGALAEEGVQLLVAAAQGQGENSRNPRVKALTLVLRHPLTVPIGQARQAAQ